MTDQELRDLVAENTKNIANLAKTMDQFIQEMRKDRKAMNEMMRQTDEKMNIFLNVVEQHHHRIETLESKQSIKKSSRTNSPTVPQAAKSR